METLYFNQSKGANKKKQNKITDKIKFKANLH